MLFTFNFITKMYLGTCFFNPSSSWEFDARDDLLRTIHRMIHNGHAAGWQGLSPLVLRYSPCEWRDDLAELNEQGQAYVQFVASTAECCGEGGMKAWIMSGWVFKPNGRTNNWLSEEEAHAFSRPFHLRAYVIILTGTILCRLYLWSAYWQSPEDYDLQLSHANS
ncbi:DUF1266 domain-containing protein [Shigella flexneri]